MRALLTLLPATGSLRPLVPLARALREAGHDVAFCSSASFRADVDAHGFPHLAAGLDWHCSDPRYLEILCAAGGVDGLPPLRGVERLAWVTEHLFIGGAARRMLPDLLDVARDWGADLILRENLEYAGCTAAEALGLPHASFAASADGAQDQRRRFADALGRLRAAAGLPPDPDMPYRHLHLCASPPSFDPPDSERPATTTYVRHRDVLDATVPLPDWAADTGGRPLVLVSLGTVFHRTPGTYEAIVEALAGEPVVAGVALGADQDPARLGPLPPHVHVEPVLPLTRLLDYCAVLVTHGGFNSVKEASSRGVPMVVMPIASDQHLSAERCAALGLAETIAPDQRHADRIGKAVRAVLGDPAYRRAARRMADEMAALPPMEEAVRRLEELG
jgi:hypothetical protein